MPSESKMISVFFSDRISVFIAVVLLLVDNVELKFSFCDVASLKGNKAPRNKTRINIFMEMKTILIKTEEYFNVPLKK